MKSFNARLAAALLTTATTFYSSQPSVAQISTSAIPRGTIRVMIEDFARLPNSANGQNAPARTNLLTTDPLGRLIANDQRGQIYRISSDGATVTPYLDLNDQGSDFVANRSSFERRGKRSRSF